MKIGFFCIKELESFIAPISTRIAALPRYNVSENWISDFTDIEKKISDCDVVWFEWANEMTVTLTTQIATLLQSKIVIVRLHSYEALAQMHRSINWSTVNAVVFVSNHVKKYCALDHAHQSIIPNGIDLKEFKFHSQSHGNNIAFLGGLSHKKGIMLLVHAFNALPDNFKLHIAGEWEDDRERIYFSHIIRELGVANRVHYDGRLPHAQVNDWLAGKNYILCTSPWEGHPVGLCEAMATGIKPLIHNFWGAANLFESTHLWSNFDDLAKMVSTDSIYDSFAYRKFIKKKYDIEDKIKRIVDLIAYLQTFAVQPQMVAS